MVNDKRLHICCTQQHFDWWIIRWCVCWGCTSKAIQIIKLTLFWKITQNYIKITNRSLEPKLKQLITPYYNITYLKCNSEETYMKNWEPLVFFPLFAIESKNGVSWVMSKFSSAGKENH